MLLQILSVIMCCIVVAGFSRSGADDTSASAPILLELFTSEGCSSCPSVDAFVEELDRSQPVPGAHLIVLSEHVDYWDHQGWKDPYSSHLFTERQADYVHALKLDRAYTPQIIVDGTSLLRGDSKQIQQMLSSAVSDAKVPVTISSATAKPGPPAMVRLHVEAVGNSLTRPAEVFLALALDHAESEVLSGENGGKHLAYVAVAEEIKKIGKIDNKKDFNQDVELKLKPGRDPGNLRLIAFVQEAAHGKVLGAAMKRPKE